MIARHEVNRVRVLVPHSNRGYPEALALDPDHSMPEMNPTPELSHSARHLLPHLAGSQFGIEESLYQAGFGSLLGSVRAAKRTRHGMCECLGDGQSLDALRAPLCRDFTAGYPPYLLRVVLEEGSIESIAKTIYEKILQSSLRSNRCATRARVHNSSRFCKSRRRLFS